jgi:hypothetical protein
MDAAKYGLPSLSTLVQVVRLQTLLRAAYDIAAHLLGTLPSVQRDKPLSSLPQYGTLFG